MNDRPFEDIDVKIREALRQEDAELLDHFRGDAPIQELLLETFRGRNRWLNVLGVLGTILIMVLMTLVAIQFFHAELVREMIAWATIFLCGFTMIALVKIWFWLELNKNMLTREIKRLELQVATLSRRVSPEK
jgi:uncharacterized membrane protein YciS (DUF1049 family)